MCRFCCFIVNKQMLGHKFSTKSLQFIYSLDACLKKIDVKSMYFLFHYHFYTNIFGEISQSKFAIISLIHGSMFLSLWFMFCPHNFHIWQHFFAVNVFSKFRGLSSVSSLGAAAASGQSSKHA